MAEFEEAVEIMVDDISTGAHNDLAKATDIACSMVKECGMSENYLVLGE